MVLGDMCTFTVFGNGFCPSSFRTLSVTLWVHRLQSLSADTCGPLVENRTQTPQMEVCYRSRQCYCVSHLCVAHGGPKRWAACDASVEGARERQEVCGLAR